MECYNRVNSNRYNSIRYSFIDHCEALSGLIHVSIIQRQRGIGATNSTTVDCTWKIELTCN
jgi:hypothetical protein